MYCKIYFLVHFVAYSVFYRPWAATAASKNFASRAVVGLADEVFVDVVCLYDVKVIVQWPV